MDVSVWNKLDWLIDHLVAYVQTSYRASTNGRNWTKQKWYGLVFEELTNDQAVNKITIGTDSVYVTTNITLMHYCLPIGQFT